MGPRKKSGDARKGAYGNSILKNRERVKKKGQKRPNWSYLLAKTCGTFKRGGWVQKGGGSALPQGHGNRKQAGGCVSLFLETRETRTGGKKKKVWRQGIKDNEGRRQQGGEIGRALGWPKRRRKENEKRTGKILEVFLKRGGETMGGVSGLPSLLRPKKKVRTGGGCGGFGG